jgi:hypothetical protein
LKAAIENAKKELKEREIKRVGKCRVRPIKKVGGAY